MKAIKKSKRSCLKYWFLGILLLLFATYAVFFFSSAIFGEEERLLSQAPRNPEFLRYLEYQRLGKWWPLYSDDGHPLGLIPSPFVISYFDDQSEVTIENLPANYDLRDENKLTPVRNQGACGSCWAFATYGSLESYLLPSETCNFSEQYHIDNHWFDYGPCDGGNVYMSSAILARWGAPWFEKDDPYIYAPSKVSKVKKHVQNIIFIPTRNSSTDNNKIKNAVKDYGAVYASMYYTGTCYNSVYNSYYNKNIEEGGHAVAIVGWKDNFSKYNFNTVPSRNGAFIVRNSWGPDWGDKGYFYVSYDDKYLGRRSFNAVFTAEPTTNYKVIYDYDPLGWVNSIGYGSTTAWFANIFKAKNKKPLRAVSFYAPGSSNNYKIYIYTNVTSKQPRSGTLALTQKGKFKLPGYYTIPLKKKVGLNTLMKKVGLKKGQRFSVVVKLTSKKWKYPIPIEEKIKDYSKKAKAKAGESFISSNGNSWSDLTVIWASSANVCLKAFAK